MIDVKKVRELSKELTVLYAEDEVDIQKELNNTFSLFFKKVIIANDGEEGLRLYKEHKSEIDLVITDIRMPNMDGLEMVEEIRKRDRDLYIVLLTAFSDQEYFVKSISLKIDKYLLKPIDQMNFINTVYDIANAISQRKLLSQFMKENQEAELRDREQKTMLKITEAYSLPMVIFNGEKLLHCSNSFSKLFSDTNQMLLKNLSLETQGLFESDNGFLKSFAGYDDKYIEFNKVKINTTSGVKVFRIYKKDVEFSGVDAQMYIFIDITYEEYLRAKAESYTHSLESMVVKQKTSKRDEEIIENRLHNNSTTDIIEESSNKQHHEKISAKEFLSTVNPSHITEIQGLYVIDRKFHEYILAFEEGNDDKL
ncbi:MAG: response regulator, partial [Campylobacterales bacterium]|nr:response regulator [Campylobacterales bacterium]